MATHFCFYGNTSTSGNGIFQVKENVAQRTSLPNFNEIGQNVSDRCY